MTSVAAGIDLSALGIFNVKAPPFGAVGDGMTDDSPAIQSAINAAFMAGGGIVYLPSGRYLINGGTITKGKIPGDTMGASCDGLPAPPTFVWACNNNYYGPNCPSDLANPNGAPGALPSTKIGPPTLPNGPLILFDNVTLLGDGPDQTVLLAGEHLYGGWIFSPTGAAPGMPPVYLANIQVGVVVANWWADYASDLHNFRDGFFAHNVYIRNLSIDCQGRLGPNAGSPSQVIDEASGDIVPNSNIKPAEDGSPIGQLYGACVTLHATQDCGMDNVWVYGGNVNGILVDGTQNTHAHVNGPLPQSFQQLDNGDEVFSPSTPYSPNPPIDQTANVPVVRGAITNCRVDMNYPQWLAGSPQATGGSNGQLPIRVVGCADVIAALNRVGQHNQPSDFSSHPPPQDTTNPPDVSPNTNDAMDCPGAWHTLVIGNVLTNCGDGIGSNGNGDLIVAYNVMYNFGSVGFLSPSTSGKSASQTIVFGNTIFLGSDFSPPQQAIAILDSIPAVPTKAGQAATATPGSVAIVGNIVYGSAFSAMIELRVLGATVVGNVFDFGGVQPQNQPNPSGTLNSKGVWPAPSGVGMKIVANDAVIEGNIFRNAGAPGVSNLGVVGIYFPPGTSGFPPDVSPDAIRVLIAGNIFDKTIGVPVQDDSRGTDGLLGVRILDNIGINPVGALDTALAPFPALDATFANPYPYDAFVTISCGATASVSAVTLDGVVTGTSIAANDQESFLVKAGGTISLHYAGAPSWVWVGL